MSVILGRNVQCAASAASSSPWRARRRAAYSAPFPSRCSWIEAAARRSSARPALADSFGLNVASSRSARAFASRSRRAASADAVARAGWKNRERGGPGAACKTRSRRSQKLSKSSGPSDAARTCEAFDSRRSSAEAGSRRHRGLDVDIPWRRRSKWDFSESAIRFNESRRRRGCHVDIPWTSVAATASRIVLGGRTSERGSVAGTYGPGSRLRRGRDVGIPSSSARRRPRSMIFAASKRWRRPLQGQCKAKKISARPRVRPPPPSPARNAGASRRRRAAAPRPPLARRPTAPSRCRLACPRSATGPTAAASAALARSPRRAPRARPPRRRLGVASPRVAATSSRRASSVAPSIRVPRPPSAAPPPEFGVYAKPRARDPGTAAPAGPATGPWV